ncbi:flagellar hook-associated protein FlgK [Falsiroseomonas oryziterrae]|uniref:flagellar hook-associated protein FlgK n=1 Tax=Falsiroseomonas oryziterrae TaxID=2911368 RepID=UPI001F21634D|nr:flagellar basal body rod C-terminal domain-containing protein [Roseomonas sp. NPKOSM-4]
MSLDLALSVARSGLRLLDRQMARTADDIANAGTEGHTRKILGGEAVSVGGVGIGVRALPLARDVDLALQAAAMRAGGDVAAGELRMRLLGGIEAAHGRPEDGDSLGGLLAALRASLVALREAPEDAIRRAAVVGDGEDLAARYNGLAAAIGSARQQAHDALVAEAKAANAALGEIGALTLDIRRELAAGRTAADLEDTRDLAIARLAESLDISVIRGELGNVTLVARGGLVLPLDGAAFAIAPATVGAGAWHGGTGTLPGLTLGGQDVTRQVLGGRMAAAAELRDVTLPRMAAELDLSAAQTAARFEAQGLRLFTDGAGAVPDVSLPYTTGGALGFAAVIRVNPAVAGNPTLVRDGTHAVVAAPGGATAFVPNPPGGPAGFATLLDRLLDFTFGREVAVGVPHAAIATGGLGPDGTLVSGLSGLVTLEAHAAALVAAQAGERGVAEGARDRASGLGQLLGARMQARSGVDVDREVAAMVELQNAYTMNARVVATVQSMWDALFSAVR